MQLPKGTRQGKAINSTKHFEAQAKNESRL